MAEVVDEGVATPAETILDDRRFGVGFLYSNTSPNANRMGCPSGQVIGVGDLVGHYCRVLEAGTDTLVGNESTVADCIGVDGEWRGWVMVKL